MDDRAVGDAFTRMSIGQAARSALDLVQQEVGAQQYQIDMDIYRRIDAGTLTGEAAMMAFATKRALYELVKRLHQRDHSGQTAAQRLHLQGAA